MSNDKKKDYGFALTFKGRSAWERLPANKGKRVEEVFKELYTNPNHATLQDMYYICTYHKNPKLVLEDIELPEDELVDMAVQMVACLTAWLEAKQSAKIEDQHIADEAAKQK